MAKFKNQNTMNEVDSFGKIISAIRKNSTKTTATITSYNDTSTGNSSDIIHVILGEDDCPINIYDYLNEKLPKKVNTTFLLKLGSIWYLNATLSKVQKDRKPRRLLAEKDDFALMLQEHDYLRIHTNPRRFPMVHEYDWTASYYDTNTNDDGGRRGVIIDDQAGNKGYWIIYKPSNVPVHPTVDNSDENVAEQIRQQLITKKSNNGTASSTNTPYVSIVQRLDQNTSGLFLVARSKVFASYFANLLRTKTQKILAKEKNENNTTTTRKSIEKGYKCLVCLLSDDKESMAKRYQTLQSYENRIMTHYLQPSIRAPKKYVRYIPSSDDDVDNAEEDTSSWLESQLRITSVGKTVYPLYGTEASDTLRHQLWGDFTSPSQNCLGVVEITIELLTGRTHQIRGQMAAEGYPLVGDIPYGGGIAAAATNTMEIDHDDAKEKDIDERSIKDSLNKNIIINYSSIPAQLALQCYYLKFLDPDIINITKVDNDDGGDEQLNKRKKGRRRKQQEQQDYYYTASNNRYNEYQLNDTDTWWYPMLQQYTQEQVDTSAATTNLQDLKEAMKLTGDDDEANESSLSSLKESEDAATITYRPELLPPRISLSAGKNKYVIVQAKMKDNTVLPASRKEENRALYFIKSASSSDCGGPYHADVATDLIDWLHAVDFISNNDIQVIGGGRIDYFPDKQYAHVYGFSYGFGKGNHAKVASLIEKYSSHKIVATYDNSPGLY